ncbi:MAG: hypothetical protein CL927_07805 [Deltaproteobacteria bacterium]|nr:hypothetical protein [Deltaproteobacteria bacterium]HCH62109.1 hypothetical protein [Deltaproteobacteria bacterium]
MVLFGLLNQTDLQVDRRFLGPVGWRGGMESHQSGHPSGYEAQGQDCMGMHDCAQAQPLGTSFTQEDEETQASGFRG